MYYYSKGNAVRGFNVTLLYCIYAICTSHTQTQKYIYISDKSGSCIFQFFSYCRYTTRIAIRIVYIHLIHFNLFSSTIYLFTSLYFALHINLTCALTAMWVNGIWCTLYSICAVVAVLCCLKRHKYEKRRDKEMVCVCVHVCFCCVHVEYGAHGVV